MIEDEYGTIIQVAIYIQFSCGVFRKNWMMTGSGDSITTFTYFKLKLI